MECNGYVWSDLQQMTAIRFERIETDLITKGCMRAEKLECNLFLYASGFFAGRKSIPSCLSGTVPRAARGDWLHSPAGNRGIHTLRPPDGRLFRR